MIFSYLELKKLAKLDSSITVKQMVQAINEIGFEVEKVTKFSDISGIKFGKILKIYRNLNSEKLIVLEIEFEDKKRIIQTTSQIVDNPENVGKKVVAFVEGSTKNSQIFQIKKMAGILSEGMLASFSELGFDNKLLPKKYQEGVVILEGEFDLKSDPVKFFGLEDYMIEVSILANRPDANSYFIFACELAAKFGKNFHFLSDKKGNFESKIKVENGQTKVLTFLETDSSSIKENLQDQLFLVKNQFKVLDKITNLANLAFLYCGTPIHAYDLVKIDGGFLTAKIVSEQVRTIDQKIINLEKNLVVADMKKSVSLASTIGFENSKIDEKTRKVLYEIANFPNLEIRKNVRTFNLETSAATIGSKNISLGSIWMAHNFLKFKLTNFSFSINLEKLTKKYLFFDKEKIEKIIGKKIFSESEEGKKIQKKLEILGFKFLENDQVEIPFYREDLENIHDLVEEFFRFLNLENLIPQKFVCSTYKINKIDIKSPKLIANGFSEVRSFSLISSLKNSFNPFQFVKTIKLKTFVSKRREEIKNSQLIPLIEIVSYNNKRKINNMSLFEVAYVNEGVKTAILITNEKNFLEFKNVIWNVFGDSLIFKKTSNLNLSKHLNLNTAAEIFLKNKKVGYFGKLNPFFYQGDYLVCEILVDQIQRQKYTKYNFDISKNLKIRDFTYVFEGKKKDTSKIVEKFKNTPGIFAFEEKDIFKDQTTWKITYQILIAAEKVADFEKNFY